MDNKEIADIHLGFGCQIVECSGQLVEQCRVTVAEGAHPIAGNFNTAGGFVDRGKLMNFGEQDKRQLVAPEVAFFVVDL